MNKGFKVLLVLFMLVIGAGLLQAAADIFVVQLRMYEGFRENGEKPGVIINSYYLKKETGDNSTSYVKVEEEQETLKHIYRLKKVKPMLRLDLALKGESPDAQAHKVKLNGREVWLKLNTVAGKKDQFIIKICEIGQEKDPMLDSEIIVPEGKTAVLGFKDAQEKIYFLAFNRKTREQYLAEKRDAKAIENPKLLKILEPEYPKEALIQEISGEVVIVGKTDLEGNIVEMKVLKGHPLLAETTRKALAQWKYSVWKIDGVKKPMDVAMIFIFRLKGKPGLESKESDREILDRCRPLLRASDTTRILPRILELVTITGKVGK